MSQRDYLAGLTLCALLQLAPACAARDDDTEEHRAVVLEIGATGEREISERTSHVAPTVGIEIEPIENWLEIEFAAAPYKSRGVTHWDLELPFKMPLRLSSTLELLPGVGPTWSHALQSGERSGTWGVEAVIDLFVWRTRRVGWYVEPSYGIAFSNGNKKTLALTGGFFFAVP